MKPTKAVIKNKFGLFTTDELDGRVALDYYKLGDYTIILDNGSEYHGKKDDLEQALHIDHLIKEQLEPDNLILKIMTVVMVVFITAMLAGWV